MNRLPRAAVLRLGVAAAAWAVCALGARPAQAVELPPVCAQQPAVADIDRPLGELRARVEALNDSAPKTVLPLMCAVIPRVEREQGADSTEMAWWLGSLTVPLIAFMDEFAQALPLLDTAQGIFERRLGPDAEELADIHVARAWIAFRQGRLADAGIQWQEALRLRERFPGHKRIELQKVLVGLAQVELSLRHFDAARAALQRARAIVVEEGEAFSAAAASIESAATGLAMREENFAEARLHAERQIEIQQHLAPDVAQPVPPRTMLGQILQRLDEYEAAEARLREAVRDAEAEQGPPQRHQTAALTQLAVLLRERGKPAEALPYAERALARGRATLGNDAPALVPLLTNLAEVQTALGQLPQALAMYDDAEGIATRHRSDVQRQSLVALDRGFGELLMRLGDPQRARSALVRALEATADQPSLSTVRAETLLAMARLESRADPDASLQALQQAQALLGARLPPGHPLLLRTAAAMCEVQLRHQGAPWPACAEATDREGRTRELEPSLRHALRANDSQRALREGDGDAALTHAQEALAAAETLGTPDPLWRADADLADLLAARGEQPLAIFFGKQALLQVEALRSRFVGDSRRFDGAFVADKTSVYRALADRLIGAGRIDEALGVLQLLKREELFDFSLRGADPGRTDSSALLTAQEQSLLARYRQALDADAVAGARIDRLARLREAGRLSVAERAEFDALLAQQTRAEASRFDAIRRFVAAGTPAAPAGLHHPVPTDRLARAVQRLGPRTALAVYLVGPTRARLLIATHAATTEVELPVGAEALRRDIADWLERVRVQADVQPQSRALYERIARPLDEAARRAGATTLVLWLDDALRYLPFAALHDGRHWLGEHYAIQLHTDAATAADAASASTRPPQVKGFGVTQAIAGWPALPAVADELCGIVRGPLSGLDLAPADARRHGCVSGVLADGAMQGTAFFDASFTEARLSAALAEPRSAGSAASAYVHVGTHFSLRPGNMTRSFLLLGDGNRLGLDRIAQLDFRNVSLMTLSACQTGVGGIADDDGREVEGLSALIQRRGVRQVVASLWQVDDASTGLLMRTMYERLAGGPQGAPARRPSTAEALQLAQQRLRQRTPREAHPFYWAGFVVSGGVDDGL